MMDQDCKKPFELLRVYDLNPDSVRAKIYKKKLELFRQLKKSNQKI